MSEAADSAAADIGPDNFTNNDVNNHQQTDDVIQQQHDDVTVFTTIADIHVKGDDDKLNTSDVIISDLPATELMSSPRLKPSYVKIDVGDVSGVTDSRVSGRLPWNGVRGQAAVKRAALQQQKTRSQPVIVFRDGSTVQGANSSLAVTEHNTNAKSGFPQRTLPWLTKEKLAKQKNSRAARVGHSDVRPSSDQVSRDDEVTSASRGDTRSHVTDSSPSPATYNIPTLRSPTQPSSPSWTFGRKSFDRPRLAGVGSRTSWEKSWYQDNPWTHKIDFHSEQRWPTPADGNIRVSLGRRHASFVTSPSYSLGARPVSDTITDSGPAPGSYMPLKASHVVKPAPPTITMGYHRPRTPFWVQPERTPGPGAYTPQMAPVHRHAPQFSVKWHRHGNLTDRGGPFAIY